MVCKFLVYKYTDGNAWFIEVQENVTVEPLFVSDDKYIFGIY